VIIRNRQFINEPDINKSKGSGWVIAANNLPAGTTKFWVSGGHANPVFYVLTAQNNDLHLFKGLGGPPHSQVTQWQQLNVQGSVLEQRFPISQILNGGILGPVFVNPYNSYQLYVLTAAGVRSSVNGGFSFELDNDLTGLISDSGKYPLTGTFA